MGGPGVNLCFAVINLCPFSLMQHSSQHGMAASSCLLGLLWLCVLNALRGTGYEQPYLLFYGPQGPALCAWHPEDAHLWCHNASVAGSVHRLGAGVDAVGLGHREQIAAWSCGMEPQSSPLAVLWVKVGVDECK